MVRIFGFHPEDPGSIPGRGAIFDLFFNFDLVGGEIMRKGGIRGWAKPCIECGFDISD